MALTGAQRQRALRSKRRSERIGANVPKEDLSEGEHRLDIWIRTGAYLDLKRIAQHRGLSRREALEQILREAGDPIPYEGDVTG